MHIRFPIEIHNKIMNYYWEFKYNDVMNEIKKINEINEEIYKYLMECYIPNVSINNETIMFNMINIFKTNKTLDEVDKEILKKLNNNIIKCSKNKGIVIISKLNYRNLFYGIENIKNITQNINDCYKYIAGYAITVSGNLRYRVLFDFQNMKE